MADDASAATLSAETQGTAERLPPVLSRRVSLGLTELTVEELVRLTRQQQQQQRGITVEDGDAYVEQSGQASLSNPRRRSVDFEAMCKAAPSAASQPRKQKRRIGASSSAPALGSKPSEASDKIGIPRSVQNELAALEHMSSRVQRRVSKLACVSNDGVRQRSARSLEPRAPLQQEELQNLPLAEALRQILIERTGSLKQAYKAMNVNDGGVLSPTQFEQGLLRAKVFGSPLVGYRDAAALFRGIDQSHKGELLLQELLGYTPQPVKHTRARDTRAQWINYNNKTSALKSRLARKPLWKAGAEASDLSSEHVRKRRELRHQLLEARTRGLLRMEEKRYLVKGLVSDEDRDRELQHEHRKMNEQNERIGDAIHSCSRARSELVALQQAILQLAPEPQRRPKALS